MLLKNERLVQRIKECYPYEVFDMLDSNKLDYSDAIAFEECLDEKTLATLGFKPTKAELWSDDAKKRILFKFEVLDEDSLCNVSIKELRVYISTVYPAMLITATKLDQESRLTINVPMPNIFESNDVSLEPWATLAKKLKSIALEQDIMICGMDEHQDIDIPFVTHYDYLGNGDDEDDEDELDFLDELPKENAIEKLKSYPAQNITLKDCLFAQDYYFI